MRHGRKNLLRSANLSAIRVIIEFSSSQKAAAVDVE